MNALALSANALHAQKGESAFTRRFEKFIDAMRRDPSAPPGFAVVVVQGDRILFQRAYGTRDVRSNAPLTLDAPIYTASTTKSFVGLLAAQLDAAGILSLDTRMSEVWPSIRLPSPMDASKVTARMLLAHISGVESPVLGWRYSDTGDYDSRDVATLLTQYAVPANRAFDYGNIGPVIYTAMVETRLRKSWRDALQQYVARPLGLKRMSARLEDFAPVEIAQCHARWGGKWVTVPQKPTALLDAGGGVLASARDAGTFLKAFTSGGKSTAGAVKATTLERTYRKVATQDRDFLGFHRTGYGLGWDLSEYDAHHVVSRSGGYPGCRSFIAFVPGEHLGVVAFALSDQGGNLFNVSIIQQAIDYWVGNTAADRRADERLSTFRREASKAIADADTVRPVPPERSVRSAVDYVAWYESPGYGRLSVSMHPDGLQVTAGLMRLLLAPMSADTFAAYDATIPGAPRPFVFSRDATGRVVSITYREVKFDRR